MHCSKISFLCWFLTLSVTYQLSAQTKISAPGGNNPPRVAPQVTAPVQGGGGGGVANVVPPDLNNSLIPPSPEAASLGKFGIMPPTLYTGMPQISIPLAEIKTSKLDLPISLTYNYNGFKPGEQATWAGQGWTLEGGGVITRMVKGLPDDFGKQNNTYHYWSEYANIADFLAEPNGDFMTAVSNHWIDTEPDIYTFHFNGHSGKFIIVGNRIFTFPRQDLTIRGNPNYGFTIQTEDGTIYSFMEAETTDGVKSNTPGAMGYNYNSSWFLSLITSSDGADVIAFSYLPYQVFLPNNYNESYSYTTGIPGCFDPLVSVTSTGSQPYIGSKILHLIKANNENIWLVPDSNQAYGHCTGAGRYRLAEVDVYDSANNTQLKRIQFNHGYFSGPSFIDSRGGFFGAGGPNYLRLDSIQIQGFYTNGQGAADTLSQTYSFNYNNPRGSYPGSTRGIDTWGYYNGADSNQQLFDSAFYPVVSNCNYQYKPADRHIYPQYSMYGMLTQLNYPTGGYTVYNYENNLVTLPRGDSLQPGPGLRVKSISAWSNSNDPGPALVKTYSYFSGKLLSTGYGYDQYFTTYDVSVPPNANTQPGNVTTLTTNFSSPVASLMADQFYYPTVTEMDDGQGANGSTTWQYFSDETDALGVYLAKKTERNAASVPLHTTSYTYQPGANIYFSGFNYTLSEVDEPESAMPFLQYNTQDTIRRFSLYMPHNVYQLNSTYQSLTATDDTTWDGSGQNPMTVHTSYYYDNPEYLHYTRLSTTNSKGQQETVQYTFPPDYNISGCITWTNIDSIFLANRAAITATYRQSIKTRDSLVRLYLHNGSILGSQSAGYGINQGAVQILENYPSESTYYTSSAALVNNLNNNLQTYLGCRGSAIGAANTDAANAILMMQYNRTLKPVEQIGSIVKNGSEYLTTAVKTDYTMTNIAGFIAGSTPKTLYQSLLPTATPVLKSTFQANSGTYYKPRINFRYDTTWNNVAEQYKTSNIHEVILWGYHSAYPVAKITGSSYAAVSSLISQYTLDNPGSDAQLRTYLQANLRQGLPNALVTTYTYAPLIGMTSETDPRGATTYYEYDALGRLHDIKNNDGNVIKTFVYHYQNQ